MYAKFVLVLEKQNTEKEIATVVVKREQKAMNRSVKAVTNTIHLSQKELQKAACCNLSESFETNPSIDVNFQMR